MEYIRFALFLIAVFAEILFVVRFFHFEKHIAPLAVILSNTLLLYLFALIDLLQVGFYTCAVIAACCIILLIVFKKPVIKANDEKLFELLPVIGFLIVCLITFLYTRGTLFYLWDEFSHWGVIYKYLMVVQHLPVNAEVVSNTNPYPPFSTLWQYLASMAISYKEENAYFAHTILQFSAIIACFPRPNKKHWGQYILFIIAAILPVFYFGYGFRFHALYVDLLLGLLLAAGFAQLPFRGRQSLSHFITVLLIASSLPLIKTTGVIFSGILIVMEIFWLFKSKDYQLGNFSRILSNWRIILLLIIPIGLWLSWNIFTNDMGSGQTKLTIRNNPIKSTEIYPWDPSEYMNTYLNKERDFRKNVLLGNDVENKLSVQEIIKAFTVNTPYEIQITAENFISKFSEGITESHAYSSKYFLSGIILVLFITYLLFSKYKNDYKITFGIYTLLIACGFILYCAALYLAYAFFFTQRGGGLEAASLERYLGSYLIAWWIFNLAAIYSVSNEMEVGSLNVFSKTLVFLVTLGLFFYLPTNLYIHLPPTPESSRFEINKMSKILLQGPVTSKDKVYDVYYGIENDYGIRHFMLRYYLTPIPTNYLDFNIRTEVPDTDHVTMILSPEEWLGLLNSQHYTYVLVSHSDPLFWNQYGKLFNTYLEDLNQPQLFKVTDEGLTFVPLE